MKNRILKKTVFSKLSFVACLIACLVALGVPSVARAAHTTTTILSSDFNAHGSPDGAMSFSGISWFKNGVYSPENTILLSPMAFVQESGAVQNRDRLAVERNIDRAGPWTINVSFMSTVEDLVLDNLTFDYQFISGGGVNQINAHSGSGMVEVSILDANYSTLSTVQIGPLGTSDRDSNSGTGIVADFADVVLTNGEMYTLRFTASSNATIGNNMSVDNFSLNGSICGST